MSYPGEVAEQVADRAGISDPSLVGNIRSQAFANSLPIMWHSMTRPTDPLAQVNRDVASDIGVQHVRYGMHNFREQMPWLAGAADAARMASPFGMAQNVASWMIPSPERPDYDTAINRSLHRRLPMAMAYNPRSVLNSPLLPIYRDVMTGGQSQGNAAIGRDLINSRLPRHVSTPIPP